MGSLNVQYQNCCMRLSLKQLYSGELTQIVMQALPAELASHFSVAMTLVHAQMALGSKGSGILLESPMSNLSVWHVRYCT